MNGCGVDVEELTLGTDGLCWVDFRALRTEEPNSARAIPIQTTGLRLSMAAVMPTGIYRVNDYFSYERKVRKDLLAAAISRRVVHLLREERERQEMSMNVLAQQSGLAQSTISRIEHELRIPNVETLLRICMVLEINLGRVIQQATAEVSNAKGG